MRSVSAELEALQAMEAGKRTPSIVATFTDGTTNYDYASRILSLVHTEQAYEGDAQILLRNDDRAVVDISGYYVDLEYGDKVSGSPETVEVPRLWVVKAEVVSTSSGKPELMVALELEDGWARLRKFKYKQGTAPYHEGYYPADTTVYDILSALLAQKGFTLQALGSADDGIIDTYKPDFKINVGRYETYYELVYRLISMTKTYLRMKPDMELQVVYPQTSDAVDATYYSDQSSWFYEYIEAHKELYPNKVIIYANKGTDNFGSLITGTAEDAVGIAKSGILEYLQKEPYITSQGDATGQAEAILSRARAEILGGRGVIPHDCRIELYDRLAFVDSRGV